MNVLFVTLYKINSFKDENIYNDLLNEFIFHNNNVYILCSGKNEGIVESFKGNLLINIRTSYVKESNLVKKGINFLRLGHKFKNSIRKYINNEKIDLVIYTTPPITIYKTIKYIKEKYHSFCYLLLKDIFPQNAIDLNLIRKGIVFNFFKKIEKKLYEISDKIGCMSRANMDYILLHNDLEKSKVEISPNSIRIKAKDTLTDIEKNIVRRQHGLPLNKYIIIYGGNIGKPQAIDLLVEIIKKANIFNNVHFLICGEGTELYKLESFYKSDKPLNLSLLKTITKTEFDKLLLVCDIGLIMLDYRFTIPNFPSRVLSYMQAGLPVISCTDTASDIGEIVIDGKFGWHCSSNNCDDFLRIIESLDRYDLKFMGNNSYNFLKEHYNVEEQYEIIMKSFNS